MSKASQRKGRSAELELAEILCEYGYQVCPGAPLSFGSVPDLVGLPDIHCEVKRVERLNIETAMEQSIRDSERFGDGMPAVFHRRNRRAWLVTMRLQDWMKLYEKGEENE